MDLKEPGELAKFEFTGPVSTLEEIDALLKLADVTTYQGRRTAAIIGRAHAKILLAQPELTFAFIETRYRHFWSKTYLLAAPLSQMPPNADALIPYSGHPADFWVFIAVNGRVEARTYARKFGIPNKETNLKWLKKTGMIFARPGYSRG